MPHLHDLTIMVRQHLPAELLGQVIVMGSAAIALRGVALGREPGDIDLFVSCSTFDAWPDEGFTRDSKHGVPRIAFSATDAIEVFAEFPGVVFEDVDARARVTDASRGLRVAALEDLLAWKRTMEKLRADAAGRNKDAADIRAIEAHMRASRKLR